MNDSKPNSKAKKTTTDLSDAVTQVANSNDKTVVNKRVDADKTVVNKTVNPAKKTAKSMTIADFVEEERGSSVSQNVDIGTCIRQRFILKERLGEGGMGSVFRALDLRKEEAGDTNPYIAIKLLNNEFEQHPKAFVSLQREAKKTQELAHPNIVTVYDFDRDGSVVYLTMEELTGYALKDVIQGRTDIKLSYKDKIRIIDEIAKGLSHAHSKGIVHSDLKPANLFYTDKGRIKILDFGIARAANEELYQDGFDAGELGALTYPYASLEMIEFDSPHPADDIYALGIIACELLGGQHPYKNKDAKRAYERKLVPILPKLKNKWLIKQLRKSIEFERDKRTQNASMFLKRFHSSINMPKRIGIILSMLLIAGAANYFYIQTIDTGVVPFDEIPVEQQQSFNKFLDEGYIALKFQDLQGAVVNFNDAYKIHGTNKNIIKAKKEIVSIIQRNIDNAKDSERKEFYLYQLDQLKNYEAFSEDENK